VRSQAISTTISERRPPVDHWQTRHGEEQAITEYLTDAYTRLIGLVGAAGYGKSALASRMVDTATGFAVTLWANFEEPVEFSTFALWLLRKLMGDESYEKVRELYQKEPPERLREAAIARLQAERYLLVLDNLETLQGDDLWPPFQDFLERWLGDGKTTSKVLLTTQVKPVLSRAEAWKWVPLGGLETSQGVQLLLDFGIEGSAAELREFVEIAEGHPLLLRCAASSLLLAAQEDYEVAAIYRLKRDDLTLLYELWAAHRGDPVASVGKVLDCSFSYLDPMLQVLLLRLSVLRGSFDLEIAQALIDEPLELLHLRKLARSSFAQEQRLGEAWRFEFLPLIKRYLAQRSHQEAQAPVGHARAAEYFAGCVGPWDGTLASCGAELEVVHHRCELGQYAAAKQVMDSCVELLSRQGFYRELVQVYERLTSEWQAQAPIDETERKNLGWAWTTLGNTYLSLGQYQSAIDCQQQTLEIMREIGDRNGEGGSLCNLGHAYRSLGQYHRAIDFYQQALIVQREVGNRQFEANSLNGLGNAYQSLGQYRRAIDFHQQHNEIAREIGDRNGEASSLGNLGNVYNSLGQYQRAIDVQQQSLEIMREIGDRNGEANSFGNLGNAYRSLGQYQRAIDFHQQHNEIAREIGDRNGEGCSLCNLGNAYQSLGQYQRAIDVQQQSLEIAREIGDRHGEASSLWSLSNLYQKCGRFKRARSHRHQAYRIWQSLHLPLEALPLTDFTKRMLKHMNDDWVDQAIASEQSLGWLVDSLSLIGLIIRWIFSPMAWLRQRLQRQR
jgi:tetratricopeptide (TPR) repeat protein